jgi:hypothetical protein
MTSAWLRYTVFIATLAAAGAALAQTVPAGSGALTGKEALHTHACNKHAPPSAATVNFTLASNGAFSATQGANNYTGTSTTLHRRTTLTLDGNSTSALNAAVNAKASSVCGTNVSVGSFKVDRATLVVNKKKTKAAARIDSEGTTSGNKKTTDRIRVVGAWQ